MSSKSVSGSRSKMGLVLLIQTSQEAMGELVMMDLMASSFWE